MKVQGTFNTQRFFETLARIISQRENVTVTVRVTPLEKRRRAASGTGKCRIDMRDIRKQVITWIGTTSER